MVFYKLRMEMVALVLAFIWRGEIMVLIDLKDAYF